MTEAKRSSNLLLVSTLAALAVVLFIGIGFGALILDYTQQAFLSTYRIHAEAKLITYERMLKKSVFDFGDEILKTRMEVVKAHPEYSRHKELQAILESMEESPLLSLRYINEDLGITAQTPKTPLLEPVGIQPKSIESNLIAIHLTAKQKKEIVFSDYYFNEAQEKYCFVLIVPMVCATMESKTANDTAELPIEQITPTLISATIDFHKFADTLSWFGTDGFGEIYLISQNGDILHHAEKPYIGKNLKALPDGEALGLSLLEHSDMEQNTHIEQWQNQYDMAFQKVRFGKSTLFIISSLPKDEINSYIDIAKRGMIVAMILLVALLLLIGNIWQRFRRREIENQLQASMTKRLEKMVDARTVELNFVTRTIKDLIDSIPSALLVLDRKLNILLVNLSFYSIFSTRLINITGKSVSEIFPEDFREKLRRSMEMKTPIIDYEMRRYVEGRGETVLQINVLNLLGKRDRLLLVIDDITERKVLERQLVQAEKMSGLGTLMAGVAHEINNPLNAIAGMAQILERKSKDETVKQEARDILQYVKRVADIVKELSRYSRSSKVTEAVSADINGIINNALKMVKHSRSFKEIQVTKNFSHSLPMLKINVVEMEQVFINLFTNAIDALEESEKTKNEGYQKKISVTTSLYKDKYVLAVIRDNAMGIAPENLKLVFDPFFSTKEQGKGTGLGLSVCYKIVQRYGGIISVDSQPNEGTSFSVRIPINQKS